MSVVDTATNTVVDTIGLDPSNLTPVSLTPDGAFAYAGVNPGGGGTPNITVIDTTTNTVADTIAVDPEFRALSIAFTPDGASAYATDFRPAGANDTLIIIDTATNAIVDSLNIGALPQIAEVTPDGAFVYVAENSSNSVVVVDTTTNTVAATIPVGASPDGLAITPDGAFVYVGNEASDDVSVVDTATNTVVDTIAVGDFPVGVAVTPDGASVYVANINSGDVTVIDTATNTVSTTIPGVALATYIDITSDGGSAYVTTFGGSVVEIDVATNTVADTVFLSSPFGISITQTPPDPSELVAFSDSFLRQGAKDRNEGANPMMRVQKSGKNRALVGFDESAINGFGPVSKATLRLTISDIGNNWGDGRLVDAHALIEEFVEGDGKGAGVPNAQSTRGTGEGVTWRCAVDSDISNQKSDCGSPWLGGDFLAATATGQIHTSGQTGTVEWDVTADVWAGAHSWLIKKAEEGQNGRVEYYTHEGAQDAGDLSLAPTLILE